MSKQYQKKKIAEKKLNHNLCSFQRCTGVQEQLYHVLLVTSIENRKKATGNNEHC